MMTFLPTLSTIVSFAFAAAVLFRFARRGGMHLLMWGIGLILYGLGTLSEVMLFSQFDAFWIKLWYLCGAVINPAWLGQGTVFLLVRRKGVAPALTVIVALVSAFALFWVFNLPIISQAYNTSLPVSEQYKNVLQRDQIATTLLTLCALYGTLTLVGGALYSAFIFWRKRVLPGRVLGNVLIAAGALAPAIGGTLVRRGLGDVLFPSELLGVILMFVGFMLATRTYTAAAVVDAPASSAPPTPAA